MWGREAAAGVTVGSKLQALMAVKECQENSEASSVAEPGIAMQVRRRKGRYHIPRVFVPSLHPQYHQLSPGSCDEAHFTNEKAEAKTQSAR